MSTSAEDLVQAFHALSSWGPDEPARAAIRAFPKTYPRFELMNLDDTESPASSGCLAELLESRRSARCFCGKEVEPSLVGAFVRILQTRADARSQMRRAIPSAGGLFTNEAYLLWRRSCGIQTAHLGTESRPLEFLWPTSNDEIRRAFPGEDWVSQCPLVVVITGRLGPSVARYGARGYRFALVEAGAYAMTISLIALEAGLSSCFVGGFDDAALCDLLDLKPHEAEFPLVSVAVGFSEVDEVRDTC